MCVFVGKLIGTFYIPGCVLCWHKISAATRDHCRSHALCARGAQYHSRFCHVCAELWDKARDLIKEPEDALRAWYLLKEWVDGFIKNSRNRVKGDPIFVSKREKEEYDDLAVVFANIAAIPALDCQPLDFVSSEVSSLSLILSDFLC